MRSNKFGGIFPRSGLGNANQECRGAKENKAQSRKDQKDRMALMHDIQPFGIYRPLLQQSYDEVISATLDAIHISSEYLQDARKLKSDFGRITINGDLGTTFIGYQAMRHGLEEAAKDHLLDPRLLIDEIEQINTPDLSVPLSHFEWGGNGRRRLLGRFTLDSTARQELDEQRRQLDTLFSKYHIRRRPIEPDHVSLVRYGKYGDKYDLNSYNKRTIVNYFTDSFASRHINNFALGTLVVGTSYSRSLSDDLNVIVKFSNEIRD